ncbi:MAG TPA: plasmid pRiA4b ORF-3 family protein [Jiangellaceae bacterium]
MGSAPTWLVLVRDVSHAVQIADEPVIFICVVFDVDTGLVLGIAALPTRRDACSTAFRTALTTPAAGAPFPPGEPQQVLCATDDLHDVSAALAAVMDHAPAPQVVWPSPEAEDIVDSFIGRLSGRAQPDDAPEPADWRHLVGLSHLYAKAQPWTDPSTNRLDLNLAITVDGELSNYVPVVLGHDRIQRGLVMYPGTKMPKSITAWRPGQDINMPDGTLMCYLEPPEETPREALGKAIRYGWPSDAELFPIFAAMASNGLADVGRRGTRHLALATAALLRHADTPEEAAETAGSMAFPDGRHGEYTIMSRPTATLEDVVRTAARTGDPRQMLDLLLSAGSGSDMEDYSPPSPLRPRRGEVVTYQVRIDLKGAKPPCWRRLLLASDLMLDELHAVLQAAFGWFDGHMHQFAAGGSSFYHADSEQYLTEYDLEDGDEGIAERDVRLDELLVDVGERFFYLYDFGDNWEHVIKLEAVSPRDPDTPRAVCMKGRRPSPPEDCGGIYGYELLTAANDSSNPRHQEALAKLRNAYGPDFDPSDYSPIPLDVESINGTLRGLFD